MRTTEVVTRCRPWLGTFVEVTADSDTAIEAAFAAIAKAHKLMNRHDPASQVAAINTRAHLVPVRVDAWTAAVLRRALYWAQLSDGAFDPVVGAGWGVIQLEADSVRLMRPAMLDLGGIAKGFAVDCAIDAMRAGGATLGLVNAGGDLRGFGPRPWPVMLVNPTTRQPVAEVTLCNAALATSAVRPDGDFGHLPQRRAGLASVSVRAPHAIDADALTKIVLAGGPTVARCLDAATAMALAIDNDGIITEFPLPARAA